MLEVFLWGDGVQTIFKLSFWLFCSLFAVFLTDVKQFFGGEKSRCFGMNPKFTGYPKLVPQKLTTQLPIVSDSFGTYIPLMFWEVLLFLGKKSEQNPQKESSG